MIHAAALLSCLLIMPAAIMSVAIVPAAHAASPAPGKLTLEAVDFEGRARPDALEQIAGFAAVELGAAGVGHQLLEVEDRGRLG